MFWKLGTSGEHTGSVSHIPITSWGFIPHTESSSSSLCVLGCSIVSNSLQTLSHSKSFLRYSALTLPCYSSRLSLLDFNLTLQTCYPFVRAVLFGCILWQTQWFCLRQGLWTTLRHANMWCPWQFPTPAIYFRWVELMTFQSSLIDGY